MYCGLILKLDISIDIVKNYHRKAKNKKIKNLIKNKMENKIGKCEAIGI